MPKKEIKLTYSHAVKRLEQIMQDMENGDMDVDQLVDTLQEALTLIAFCKKRLTEVDSALHDVIDNQQDSDDNSQTDNDNSTDANA